MVNLTNFIAVKKICSYVHFKFAIPCKLYVHIGILVHCSIPDTGMPDVPF